uniref:Uncharacterized protein n=1 Tax=Anguilla anguilla TaxID=7936 RepID=A0A0E9PKH3_ANGAN
MNPYFRFRIL